LAAEQAAKCKLAAQGYSIARAKNVREAELKLVAERTKKKQANKRVKDKIRARAQQDKGHQ
jgi:hypothetical protein